MINKPNNAETKEANENYQSLIGQVIRPRSIEPDTEEHRSALSKTQERISKTKRGTIVEEPLLETLCEISQIEPNHLLYDVMTKGERRSLVQKFGTNRNTARIFENEATLKEFMNNATITDVKSTVSRNTIAIGRTSRGLNDLLDFWILRVFSDSNRASVKPVSISSVSGGKRMGAPERWESIRQHINESRPPRDKARKSRISRSEATFEDVIQEIIKHRESQLRLKRHLVSHTIEELSETDINIMDSHRSH